MAVHGGPGWDYRSLLPLKALADDYFVVFYDQRGSGLSPRVSPHELSLQSSLDDLDMMVDKFRHGRRVILIGHSWGAMLVTAYLGREPDKVNRAVLAEPGFLTTEMFERSGITLGPKLEAEFLWFATRKWFESLHVDSPDGDAAMDYFMGEVAARANPGYYCNGEVPEVGTLHWRAGAIAMKSVLSSEPDEQGGMNVDLTVGLERFTRPVLLLAGACNTLIGAEQQGRHQQYFVNSRLIVIEQSGHMLFAERPKIALRIVRQFLNETVARDIQ